MPLPKDDSVNVRVSAEMRRQLGEIADHRGERLGVIVREAINQYLALQESSAEVPAPTTAPPGPVDYRKRLPKVKKRNQ